MGSARRKRNKRKQKINYDNLPFVSVCTPTFNRRPFIKSMIQCFNNQDYPKDKMEWIIIDDGTDKIEDLVTVVPQVKYFKYDEKMTLGKKRNLMHSKSKGDIIVYMDDDDFYPSDRVSHAVETLTKNTQALCAGSSEVYIYFKHVQKMYRFGPYGPNHATAGTFAFKRELLNITSYEDEAALAEEKHFLKNYTIPFVQLNPMKTILVFSHQHNTFDKKKLLNNPHPKFVNESAKTVNMFIKDKELRQFFMEDIEGLLENYEPGKPEMKPDVIKQTKEIEEKRRKMNEQKKNNIHEQITINIETPNGVKQLKLNEFINLFKEQQGKLQQIIQLLQIKDNEILKLKKHIEMLENKDENKHENKNEDNVVLDS